MVQKKKLIETRKQFYPFDFQKYLTLRNILIVIILGLLYFMFPQYVQAIILMIIFYPISMVTVKTTKYLRGIGIETVTAFTLFLGYLYGWKIGFFFGFILGSYIWAQCGLNQFTIVQCVLNGLSAFIGAWASGLGFSFLWGYIIAAMVRNIIAFLIFLPIQPDPVKNFSHTICDIVWNTLILSQILTILYELLAKFN